MTLRPKNLPQQTKPHLQWLFVAEFADGHVIKQDPEDTCHSRTDGTGSAFSDVLAYAEAHGRPVAFGLHNIDGKQVVGVDLISGNFVVNGTPTCAHNQNFDPTKYELELIYFRETRVEQDVRGTKQADGSVSQEQVGEIRHFVNRYFLGWQTQVNGKNRQITLAVG